ncbi:anti-sigma factor [Falsirhodobacter sp. 20TX0035]|uniref:anti-sigma factor n=1 Tax=Falsirhodobacter sp. 20TX0035 TaxID=3022019 RepID=UPI00232D1A48|nr:anti-sigma factor [Falsirhodobacter sp. 20TX0035]MDB6453712.1 anti-sigma factor [Falsirhodobacter sp. 20TX0035]
MSETDLRAEEFVLGLLDPATEAELTDALEHDRVWAAAVGRARDRLRPLDDTAPDLPGAARLWDGVAARLGPAPARRRWLPLGAATAAGLAVGLFIGGTWFTPDPIVLAVLVDEAGTPTAVVEDFGHADARIRFVRDIQVPQGRQMQVWTLPSAETGPVSLGLLRGAAGTELDAPRLPDPGNGQLYEITLEPAGGSPTGRPTGAILAKGLAARQDGV